MLSTRSDRAKFLSQSKLIIWEEMPMANKAAVECADAFMRLIMGVERPFGGKVFLGLGDFRQVAPVVKGSGPTATYEASIQSSHLWPHFKVLTLDMPVRNVSDPEYSVWVDSIGEGANQHNQPLIDISLDLIDEIGTYEEIIEFLFPHTIMDNYDEISKRSFLSPLNIHVDEFNNLMLEQLPSSDRMWWYSNSTELYVLINGWLIRANILQLQLYKRRSCIRTFNLTTNTFRRNS